MDIVGNISHNTSPKFFRWDNFFFIFVKPKNINIKKIKRIISLIPKKNQPNKKNIKICKSFIPKTVVLIIFITIEKKNLKEPSLLQLNLLTNNS